MSRNRGLAAMKAPKCAGRATSRALLYPILSKPWKESLERPFTSIVKDLGGFFFLKDRVTVYSENVVDSVVQRFHELP